MSAIRILFVSRDCLQSGRSGGSTYAKDILTFLSDSGFDVDLVLLKPGGIKFGFLLPAFLPGTRIRLRSPGFHRILGTNLNWLGLALLPLRLVLGKFLSGQGRRVPGTPKTRGALLMRRVMRLPYPTHPPVDASYFEADPTPGETKYLLRQLRSGNHQSLVLNYICLTPLLDAIPEELPLQRIVLAHDLWSLRAKNLRAASLEADLKEWTEAEEAARYQKADLVLGISLEEREHFIRLLGEERVMTIPKAIRLTDTQEEGKPGRCFFVGTEMGTNLDALRWFMESAWPTIRSRVPYAELHIYGTICNKLINPPAGVILNGVVANLESAYHDAQVVIVPLRAGSGVKIKLTEAIGFNKCCVATRCGVQGLPRIEESGVLVADDPALFADQVIHFMECPAARAQASDAMVSWARSHMSADACYGGIRDWMIAHAG